VIIRRTEILEEINPRTGLTDLRLYTEVAMKDRLGPNDNPIVSEFSADPEMSDLVALFLGELPARIAALETAWRDREVRNVSRIAHQLKGACSGYGFPTLGSAAATLENRLRGVGVVGDGELEKALGRASADFRQLIELCSRACRSAA
jgi:HPt (histidine-containing phosphotransfer) domain-containing protein